VDKKSVFILWIFMAALGIYGCGKPASVSKEPISRPSVDFNKIVQQKDAEYKTNPLVNSKTGLFDRRIRIQNQILEEFNRCPDCIAQKIAGAQRTYLFDAVTDCETSIRVGSPFDGGKWICSPQSLPLHPIVYSFGIGEDITFDSDMAGLFGCDVFMFDPSPSVVRNFEHFNSGQPCGQGRLYFETLGLGPVSNKDADPYRLIIEGKTCPVRNLADIARAHGHTRIDVLKIDIEGGEFASLKQILATNSLGALQVNQLLVEFHLIDDQCFKDFILIIGLLQKQGYLLFRKEFNPYVADKCAEFAFVKK
jgi:hypothetical protein